MNDRASTKKQDTKKSNICWMKREREKNHCAAIFNELVILFQRPQARRWVFFSTESPMRREMGGGKYERRQNVCPVVSSQSWTASNESFVFANRHRSTMHLWPKGDAAIWSRKDFQGREAMWIIHPGPNSSGNVRNPLVSAYSCFFATFFSFLARDKKPLYNGRKRRSLSLPDQGWVEKKGKRRAKWKSGVASKKKIF